MIVRWDQGGLPEIQMELKTEHVQATSTSQNLILFILAKGLANGAFKNYNTVDDIFDVRAPRSKAHSKIVVNCRPRTIRSLEVA